MSGRIEWFLYWLPSQLQEKLFLFGESIERAVVGKLSKLAGCLLVDAIIQVIVPAVMEAEAKESATLEIEKRSGCREGCGSLELPLTWRSWCGGLDVNVPCTCCR